MSHQYTRCRRLRADRSSKHLDVHGHMVVNSYIRRNSIGMFTVFGIQYLPHDVKLCAEKMIQIQLPMSVTATAKLEPKKQRKREHKRSTKYLQLSDVAMAKSQALHHTKSSSKTNASVGVLSAKSSFWWIHGKEYDLTDFIDRHPGGLESILLGKGRDCTALVESYHAFSTLHWKVLEKYEVKSAQDCDVGNFKQTQQSTTSQEATGEEKQPQHDFFYEILKERVASALLEKGLDPIKDRGATTQRIVYYVIIFSCWLYTGYLHMRVRFVH